MRKIHLFMEGNKIAATWDNFDCLATSPVGFGDNISGAVKDLITNSSVIEINDIVTSIENEPFKERASENQGTGPTGEPQHAEAAGPQRDCPPLVVAGPRPSVVASPQQQQPETVTPKDDWTCFDGSVCERHDSDCSKCRWLA